jgi:hypothetical protein
MNTKHIMLISSTGILLLNTLSLQNDLSNSIYPLKLSVVRILMDVPETYLIYLIENDGLKHLLGMLKLESEQIIIENNKDNNIVTNRFVPILLVIIRILKIKQIQKKDAFDIIKKFIFPHDQNFDNINAASINKNEKEPKKRNMEPNDAPKFTLRRYLISMLLQFSSNVNVIVPLGDLLYLLCNEDGEELIKRCGLGYSAGILQRQGALGQFMAGVPSNF